MDKTTILRDEEVQQVARSAMQSIFGSDMAGQMETHLAGFEDKIRLFSLAAKTEQSREEQGLTIKDISGRLKIPQYRLKAIEEGEQDQIRVNMLKKYLHFLDIEAWFKQWVNANLELALKLDIEVEKYLEDTNP